MILDKALWHLLDIPSKIVKEGCGHRQGTYVSFDNAHRILRFASIKSGALKSSGAGQGAKIAEGHIFFTGNLLVVTVNWKNERPIIQNLQTIIHTIVQGCCCPMSCGV